MPPRQSCFHVDLDELGVEAGQIAHPVFLRRVRLDVAAQLVDRVLRFVERRMVDEKLPLFALDVPFLHR